MIHVPRTPHNCGTQGYVVEADDTGSRAMACRTDLTAYDVAFPGSRASAETVRAAAHGVLPPVDAWRSPIVIATFTQVAEKLRAAGVVSQDLHTFAVGPYLERVVGRGERWRDLGLQPPFPALERSVLASTRLDTSNSAEMYLALASYVANGNRPVTPQVRRQAAHRHRRTVPPAGQHGLSSDETFAQFLSPVGYQPPALIAYEAQIIGAPGDLRTDVVLADGDEVKLTRKVLYPTPGIVSVHTAAPLSPRGDAVARLLVVDPRLRELAARHGFRPTGDAAAFAEAVSDGHASLPVLTGPPGPEASCRPPGSGTTSWPPWSVTCSMEGPPVRCVHRALAAVVAVASVVAATACTSGPAGAPRVLRILAGSELADLTRCSGSPSQVRCGCRPRFGNGARSPPAAACSSPPTRPPDASSCTDRPP